MIMSVDVASMILGAAIPCLGFLLTIAVSWGRFSQNLKDLVQATHELRTAVVEVSNRTTALEAASEASGERLDRLEAPLFHRQ